jgi:6-pyruvoyltetrahydropterin/6-carboxytetrahydropterin synthase
MTTLHPIAYKFTSTKEYVDEFPCAYKQWKADTACNLNHGYSFSIKFYFGANQLDKRGWVIDYGGLRDLKDILKQQFDHKTIIAKDDPDLEKYRQLERDSILELTVLPGMGCERIADMLYKFVNGVYIPDYLGQGESQRIWCYRVEVRETESNMSWREGHREWNENLLEDV